MITKFSYTARADDIYEFYSFWLKQQHIGALFSVIGLIWLVPTAISAVLSGEYKILLLSAAAFGAMAAVLLISMKRRTRKSITQLIRLDKTYLCETAVTVFENAIELQTNAPAGEAQVTEIYPFELLHGAYETQRHFYLVFANSEAKVIPKKSIPGESAEKLSEKICKNPSYKFISQEKK